MMTIKRFDQINGADLEQVDGQGRYYYYCRIVQLDPEDAIDEQLVHELYSGEKPEIEHLYFYDTETGQRYEPIPAKENVYFDYEVKWCNGWLYFYLADFDEHQLRVYRYLPEKKLELVYEFPITEEILHTTMVLGDDQVYLMIEKNRSDDIKDLTADLEFYSPQKFTVTQEDDEFLCFIHDDQLYFTKELDAESETDLDPKSEIVVKDFNGKVVKQELGDLTQDANGDWWIS